MMRSSALPAIALAVLSMSAPARSEIAPGAEIPLAPAVAGAPPVQVETLWGHPMLRNVTRPVLIPFLPEAGKATGAAVIVAPGGGFQVLSLESEGLDVARWLASHGVAAFVLEYRLEPTPTDSKAFRDGFDAMIARLAQPGPDDAVAALPGEPRAVEDGLTALRLVRNDPARWGLDPARIGFMGFSAGGMVAAGVATRYDAGSRPAFVGVIYGALKPGATPPADAPPAFVAVAADDIIVRPSYSLALYEAWTAARRPVELHIFQAGQHGFGMRPQNLTSDRWIDEYYWWLQANGFLTPGRSR